MSMSRYSEEFANIDFANLEDVFDLVHGLHQMNKINHYTAAFKYSKLPHI